MSPDAAIEEARSGKLRPVYLLVGEERWLLCETLGALARAALQGGVPGLNEERLTAGEADVARALAAARTLPMMARWRLVVVREVERWDADADAVEELLRYARTPSPSTVLVLTAGKLDGRRKLQPGMRQLGAVVSCDPLARRELPGWIERQFALRGHDVASGVADLVADLAGPELGAVADAVERLSLHAAEGARIAEADVMACLVRLRPGSVWELTDAVARRDLGAAVALLADVVADPNEAIRTVGALAGAARKLLRMEAELSRGAAPEAAAQTAGLPPFKAREAAQQCKQLGRTALEDWLLALARVDRDLKGGSRRPARAVLEDALLSWSAGRAKGSHESGQRRKAPSAGPGTSQSGAPG